MDRHSDREVQALLDERYGSPKGLLREAVAKPSPVPRDHEADAARHREQLLQSMQMGVGAYGRRRKDWAGSPARRRREPDSTSAEPGRSAIPQPNTSDNQGGRVSPEDNAAIVGRGTDSFLGPVVS